LELFENTFIHHAFGQCKQIGAVGLEKRSDVERRSARRPCQLGEVEPSMPALRGQATLLSQPVTKLAFRFQGSMDRKINRQED
ncbi:MAG: hypothetical protein ACODAD_10475, partial [Planctomycetota bacterium]